MSLRYLLAISEALHNNQAVPHPVSHRPASCPRSVLLAPPREPLAIVTPELGGTANALPIPVCRRTHHSLKDWLKLAFLLSLLFLCTGALSVNYLCQKRQEHAWATLIQQQELRADRYWREMLWYRAQAAQAAATAASNGEGTRDSDGMTNDE